jgi:SAM-dependent methyltransferase
MNDRLPNGPALILDLGSGPASSTKVIASYSRSDWRIVGIDFAKNLIERANKMAAREDFQNFKGEKIKCEFVQQSITKTLHFSDGSVIPDNSVDFVNSSGIVGHHLDSNGIRALAMELYRIVKATGIVALDPGPVLGSDDIISAMRENGFELDFKSPAIFLDPRPKLVFKKR